MRDWRKPPPTCVTEMSSKKISKKWGGITLPPPPPPPPPTPQPFACRKLWTEKPECPTLAAWQRTSSRWFPRCATGPVFGRSGIGSRVRIATRWLSAGARSTASSLSSTEWVRFVRQSPTRRQVICRASVPTADGASSTITVFFAKSEESSGQQTSFALP